MIPQDLLVGILIGSIVVSLMFYRYIHLLKKSHLEGMVDLKTDTTKRVRSVNLGFDLERIAPYISGIPYKVRDMNFFGKPIDFICFDGLADNSDEISIKIIDIKSGTSRLNKSQRLIRDAVKAGRVSFEVVRLSQDSGELVNIKTYERSADEPLLVDS